MAFKNPLLVLDHLLYSSKTSCFIYGGLCSAIGAGVGFQFSKPVYGALITATGLGLILALYHVVTHNEDLDLKTLTNILLVILGGMLLSLYLAF